MLCFEVKQTNGAGFVLGAAQCTRVDDAAPIDDFIAAAVGMAVKDVIASIFDKGLDFAGYVAMCGGDADTRNEFADKLIGSNTAGVEVEQCLPDSERITVHVAMNVDEGEAGAVHGRCR